MYLWKGGWWIIIFSVEKSIIQILAASSPLNSLVFNTPYSRKTFISFGEKSPCVRNIDPRPGARAWWFYNLDSSQLYKIICFIPDSKKYWFLIALLMFYHPTQLLIYSLNHLKRWIGGWATHFSVQCNDWCFHSCEFQPHIGKGTSSQIRSKLHKGTTRKDLIPGPADLSFEYLKQIQCMSSVNRFHKLQVSFW